MGAQVGALKNQDKDAVQFVSFLQKRKKADNTPSQKSTWSYEIKWKNNLLEILDNLAKRGKWKSLSEQIKEITYEIKIQNFIKAISVVSAMDNPDVFELNSKSIIKYQPKKQDVRLSKNVFIDLDKRFDVKSQQQSYSTETEITIESSSKKVSAQEYDRHNKQLICLIIAIQFNRPYHPFFIVKSSFMMIFIMKYRHILNQINITNKNKQKIYDQMHQDLNFLAEFIANGSWIYKKWILQYGNIKQDKFLCFMKKIALNSIFYGTNNMYSTVIDFIKQMNSSYFQTFLHRIKQNVSVQKFYVCKELEIQGNFLNSLQLLSQFDRIQNPFKLINELQRLKNQICNDIDLYHKYFQSGQNYKIDGDNLLGILCFQLSRMKHKIKDIYAQLIIISVIYGQSANISFGVASYMLTTLTAAFQYLQNEQAQIQQK